MFQFETVRFVMLTSVFLVLLIDIAVGQKILIVNVVNGLTSQGSKPFNFSQASRDQMNESKDYEDVDLWYHGNNNSRKILTTTTTTTTSTITTTTTITTTATTTTTTTTKIPGK